jgi:hypothetical protein
MKLPYVTRNMLTLYCSRHVLPLSFFEDDVVCKGFGIQKIYRQEVKAEIKTLCLTLKNNFLTIKHANGLHWLLMDGKIQ